MNSHDHRQQISALASDLRSYVEYLKELGVNHARDTISEKRTLKIIDQKNMPNTVAQNSLFSSMTAESLEEIRADIGDCHRCPLYTQRTQIVHSTGNPKARLVFIGEAPGADEDEQGFPFVGRAGQLLTKIIESIGFKREEVFIGNVNRCRPPGNRPPAT
ncbi:MAG: uracil-DNA glycosylase, partial [Pyrinomonadaceae bacterium]